jgi:putative aldouronate transport system substrate-binding protein
MKRFVFLFLGLALAASAFAGGARAGSGATGKTSRAGAKGSLPLATNKPTLTMFNGGAYADNLTSLDYKDNIFTKKIVDETGINLVITSTSVADVNERLNIMLNTGDYPDIVTWYNGNPIDMDYYAQQGIFIPLDAYDPMSFPNIKKAFELYPEAKAKVTGSDGKLYGLPTVDFCLHCTYQYGRVWYYMPWIRDYNRKVPETTEELTEFLRWVKNSDPNKNGRRDEVGIAFMKDDLYNFVAYIAKAYMPFVYTGIYFGLSLDNSKNIVEQYRDNDFRSALAYIAGLYKEGLIVPDSFSMQTEQLQVIARSQDSVAAMLGAPWYNGLVPQLGDKYMEYFNLPPLKTASGQRYASNGDPWSNVYSKFFITNKCKDPELAIALYDYFLRDDVQKSAYGPKDVFWVDPDPGAVGYDGKPAYWKWIGIFGLEPLNSHWSNSSPHVWEAKMKSGIQMDDVDIAIKYMATGDKSLQARVQSNTSYGEFMWYNISNESSKYAMPNSVFIPPLIMNTADTSRAADINAVLDPFKKQVFVEFITGVRDINNNAHWNAYLSELDRLGSKEMVQILQKYIK